MAADARAKVSARAIVALTVVAVIVYALDQIAKALVVANMTEGQHVDVLGPLLVFEYVRNSGAAFSIGEGSAWIFTIIATGVLVFVIWYARRIRSFAWAVLFGLLLGGLLGNLSDRIFRAPGIFVGEVVDFLRIPLLPAVFNLADTAITASMVMFLLLTILGVGLDGKREHAKPRGGASGSGTDSGSGTGSGEDATGKDRNDTQDRTGGLA